MEIKLLLAKLDAAKHEIADAESDLEKVIGEIGSAARAEKTTISLVVENAFQKLRNARADLIELEEMVRSGERPQKL